MPYEPAMLSRWNPTKETLCGGFHYVKVETPHMEGFYIFCKGRKPPVQWEGSMGSFHLDNIAVQEVYSSSVSTVEQFW